MLPDEFKEQAKTANLSNDRISSQEYDVIRILLNYGLFLVHSENVTIDENGKEVIETVEVSVIELILHELERDHIKFQLPIYETIHQLYREGLEKGEMYGEKFFLQHENQEVASKAVDIISNRHEISPKWIEKKVYTTTEVEKLELVVKQSIYSYKAARLRNDKDTIQAQIEQLNSSDSEENFNEIMTSFLICVIYRIFFQKCL